MLCAGFEVGPQHASSVLRHLVENWLASWATFQPRSNQRRQIVSNRLHVIATPLAIGGGDSDSRRRGVKIEGFGSESPQFARSKAGACRDSVEHRADPFRTARDRDGCGIRSLR